MQFPCVVRFDLVGRLSKFVRMGKPIAHLGHRLKVGVARDIGDGVTALKFLEIVNSKLRSARILAEARQHLDARLTSQFCGGPRGLPLYTRIRMIHCQSQQAISFWIAYERKRDRRAVRVTEFSGVRIRQPGFKLDLALWRVERVIVQVAVKRELVCVVEEGNTDKALREGLRQSLTELTAIRMLLPTADLTENHRPHVVVSFKALARGLDDLVEPFSSFVNRE